MKIRKSFLFLLVIVFSVFSLSFTVLAKVKINKKSATISVGSTVQLQVTGAKGKVKWSSSNKKVASVSDQGFVTGKESGRTTIKAKLGKKTYQCKMTVKKGKALNSVTLPDEVYNAVKGRWYTQTTQQVGSDAKFTRTKLIKYERGSHKVISECNLISVEKLYNGFYGFYKNQYKLTYNGFPYNFFYISVENVPLGDKFHYFEDHKDGQVHPSGMATLIPKVG